MSLRLAGKTVWISEGQNGTSGTPRSAKTPTGQFDEPNDARLPGAREQPGAEIDVGINNSSPLS